MQVESTSTITTDIATTSMLCLEVVGASPILFGVMRDSSLLLDIFGVSQITTIVEMNSAIDLEDA